LPELREVDIRQNPGLVDLSPLGSLPLLGSVFAGGSGAELDLSPLAGLTILRRIHYQGAIANDLSVVGELPALEALELDGTAVSAAAVAHIATAPPTFRTLSMANAGVSDLEPLGPLVTLQNVDFSGNDITSIAIVSTWAELSSINVSDNPLASLAGLETHEFLASVDAHATSIADLDALAGNETFRSGDAVDARETGLSADDCAAIAAIVERFGVVETDLDCG
jgi:internalin A